MFNFIYSAIISLPHEIQRNLTMIKEHDSKVQGIYFILLFSFSFCYI